MSKKIFWVFIPLLSACVSVEMEDYNTFDCTKLKAKYKKALLDQMDSFNERMKSDEAGVFSMIFGTTDKSSVSYEEERIEGDLNYLRSLLRKKNCAQNGCELNKGENQ